MPEKTTEEEVATVFINDLEDGEREVRLEAGEVFEYTTDGPANLQIEAHDSDDDD